MDIIYGFSYLHFEKIMNFNYLWPVLLIVVLETTSIFASSNACCTFLNGNRVFMKSVRCEKDPIFCCESVPRFPLTLRGLLRADLGTCHEEILFPYLSSVEVCSAPTRYEEFAGFLGVGLDAVSHGLDLKHAWIRTPHKEAGMGTKVKFSPLTEWQDHTGLGENKRARCHPLPGCDVNCVEDKIQLGQSTGLYSLINTCQHLVNRVIRACGCYDLCVAYNNAGFCVEWAWPKLK